ncbi:isochorismatase family protein [Planomonospora sp. ID82291]|uniref:isochorismatase family protein n=1 Tax=Planomonospora sp. ID82291 TaxID=2738136 RepID=UPI0018C39D57|nr:isochorismatase family protein [Planomonospora sp. ID82291]
MAIPPIQPYPMPDTLPANRVAWRPDARRAVLLVHDMQNHFVRAFTPGRSPLVELMSNVLALREHCAALGVPVVYSAQPGGQSAEQRGLLLDFWGDGIGPDPHDARIVEELAPREGDVLLTKWRYSAYQRTGLAELMDSLGRDQLIVCGIYAHIGVLMTACEAFMRDVQPFVVADAVADFSAEHHRMALDYAAQRCAVTVTTRQLSRALTREVAGV